jgi:hypothetical protein
VAEEGAAKVLEEVINTFMEDINNKDNHNTKIYLKTQM